MIELVGHIELILEMRKIISRVLFDFYVLEMFSRILNIVADHRRKKSNGKLR